MCRLLGVLALGGCMVGPDYAGPPEVAPDAASAAGFHRASVAQAIPTPPLAEWWTALDDPVLDQIEAMALTASPTLEAAEAVVRESRAGLRDRQAGLLPQGGANALYLRTRLPDPLSGSIPALGGIGAPAAASLAGSSTTPTDTAADLFSGALDATWQIDIFGGTRRQIEAARAGADYEQAEFEDAQVTLTIDVARAYVELRDNQRRLGLTRENAALQLRMVDLAKQRRAGGTASDLDVERLTTQMRQTESQIPRLAADVEVYTDQLAELAGQQPGSLDALVAPPRAIPLPPAEVAVGDPAALIRRRPDIRAAERQIAASNALIGAAVAQYFPQVTLLGSIGYAAPQTKDLFSGKSLTYLGGPSIAWNIFNAPAISAEVSGAKAATDAARASYRRTVLSALTDAENALSRFGHQRDDVVVLAQAEASARRSAELSDRRLAGGTTSLIDTLDIDRQRIQTQTSLAQGQAQLTSDWVSLQSSLGIGWGTQPTQAQR